jgi:hypothetical protein
MSKPLLVAGCPVLSRFLRKGGQPSLTPTFSRVIYLIRPKGLRRCYGADYLHFITCSCYRRGGIGGNRLSETAAGEKAPALSQKARKDGAHSSKTQGLWTALGMTARGTALASQFRGAALAKQFR